MSSSLWVLPESTSAFTSLQSEFETAEDAPSIVRFRSFATALTELNKGTLPCAVVALVDQSVPGFLDLMSAMDAKEQGIPFLGLVQGALETTLPIETSALLTFVGEHQSPRSMQSKIVSMLSNSKNPQSFRRGGDYFAAAVLSKRSVSLDLSSKTGKDLHLEIVGGDIWNAYCGELESVEALEAFLYELVSDSSARSLQTIPGERQIGQPGLRVLAPAIRRILQHVEEAEPPAPNKDFGTQEIVVNLSVPAETRREEQELPGDPEPPPNEATDSPADQFEQFLTNGIQASLARDYQRARENFEAALRIDPNDTRAIYNLQRICERLEKK